MIELISYTPNAEQLLRDSYSKCYQKPINYEKMIQFLKHESVLEHVNFTFDIKCSRITHLQWVRHRIASYTSQSMRYTKPIPEDLYYYIPPQVFKDGDVDEWINDMESQFDIYEKWLAKGYKKEDARYHLPDSCAINFQCTMNLRSIINFGTLRTDNHAQDEIKGLAKQMLDIAFNTMPNLKPHLEKLIDSKQE